MLGLALAVLIDSLSAREAVLSRRTAGADAAAAGGRRGGVATDLQSAVRRVERNAAPARASIHRALTWTSGEGSALLSVILVDIWEWTPFLFLLLSAGLQAIPLEPLEAARIDGARRLADLSRRHAAVAEAGHRAGAAAARDGSGAHLRSDFHPDAGRSGHRHRNRQPVHLPHGVPIFEFRLRGGDVVRAAGRDHAVFARIDAGDEVAMKTALALSCRRPSRLLIALAPVYWLVTISLKREIDQFAYPPQWIGFHADASSIMRRRSAADRSRYIF